MPRHHLRVPFFVSFLGTQKRKTTIKYSTSNLRFLTPPTITTIKKMYSMAGIRNDVLALFPDDYPQKKQQQIPS
jgi:hypothetical protein